MTPPPTLTLCNYSFYKITLPQFKGQPDLGGAGGTGGTLPLISPLFYFDFFFFLPFLRHKTFERAEEEINPPLSSTRPYIEAHPVCLFACACVLSGGICVRARGRAQIEKVVSLGLRCLQHLGATKPKNEEVKGGDVDKGRG